LAGAVASKSSSEFASFAVLGSNYVNLNIRFGYHFTQVVIMCDNDATKNYCLCRFTGGGDFSGRSLRIDYVDAILQESGFQVTPKGDLLGVTKLMDMRLKDDIMVKEQVESFWQAA